MIDQRIFSQPDFHGVKGLIFIGDRILLYRRDNKTNKFPLKLDLPGGGREGDESPIETFQRECKEEFGLDIKKDDINYARQYTSMTDPTKESYFFAAELSALREKDIIFGDEGLEFLLMKPEEYLDMRDVIPWQQVRTRDYLHSVNHKI